MPTFKQERLAEELILNAKRKIPKNKKTLLVGVGYSETLARAEPSRTLKSEGVAQALANRGFTLEGAKAVVQEIMYSKKAQNSDKLRATEQVFKVLGAYTEKHVNVNLDGLSIGNVLDVLEGKHPQIASECPRNDENKKEVS